MSRSDDYTWNEVVNERVSRSGEEAAFAGGAERKPGRSARSSRSKSSSRDESTLKGLVEGVGAAGSSNASGRASFVGVLTFLVSIKCVHFRF